MEAEKNAGLITCADIISSRTAWIGEHDIDQQRTLSGTNQTVL